MLATWVAAGGEVQIAEGPGGGTYTGYGRIEARLGSAPHGWRGAQALASDGESPIAAVGANGTAAVAWCRRPENYIRLLYVSIAPPGRRFGPATRLGTSGHYPASCPQAVEVQPDGRVVVIWSQTLEYSLTPIRSRIQFALLSPDGGRPVIGTVSSNVPGEVDPTSAETGDGDVLLALGSDGAEGTQGVARLQPGAGRFSSPQAIQAAGDAIIRGARISSGPDGAALVFSLDPEEADGEAYEDAMVEQDPDGAFGPTVAIVRQPKLNTGDQFRPEGVSVAFPVGGARVAAGLNVFVGPSRGPVDERKVIGPAVVVVAVRPSGTASFQAPVQVSAGAGRSGLPLSASAGTGAVVIWAQAERGCKQRVYSTLVTAGAPLAPGRPLSGSYRSTKDECAEGSGQLALAGSSGDAIAAWIQNSSLHVATTAAGNPL
jgi:hypothetical protein